MVLVLQFEQRIHYEPATMHCCTLLSIKCGQTNSIIIISADTDSELVIIIGRSDKQTITDLAVDKAPFIVINRLSLSA